MVFSMYREGQQWVSTTICKTEWRLCHGLELQFSHWCWDLVKIDGIMNAEKHRQILIHPFWYHLIGNSFVFQREKDPKHVASAVKAYLDGRTHHGRLSVMDWPPQGLDFRIIEAAWHHFDKKWSKNIYIYIMFWFIFGHVSIIASISQQNINKWEAAQEFFTVLYVTKCERLIWEVVITFRKPKLERQANL